MSRRAAARGGLVCGTALLATGALAACGGSAAPERATLVGAETESSASAQPPSGEPQIAPEPSGGPTPSGGRPWDDSVTSTCVDLVGRAFRQVAQSEDDGGVTSFWVSGRDWRLCDVAASGAAPTVFGPAGHGAHGFDEATLAIAATPLGVDTRLVAGGRLPWPVDEIRYDLPDGSSAAARFVTGQGADESTWWVMTHTLSDDVLGSEDGGGQVTISVTGAAAEAWRLPWAEIQRSE